MNIIEKTCVSQCFISTKLPVVEFDTIIKQCVVKDTQTIFDL